MWENPIVKRATVDDRHRILIRDLKPGQVFTWEDNGNGQITLLELKPKARQARKTSILDGLKPLTAAEAEGCWGPGSEDAEWDKFVAHCASLPVGPPPKDE